MNKNKDDTTLKKESSLPWSSWFSSCSDIQSDDRSSRQRRKNRSENCLGSHTQIGFREWIKSLLFLITLLYTHGHTTHAQDRKREKNERERFELSVIIIIFFCFERRKKWRKSKW